MNDNLIINNSPSIIHCGTKNIGNIQNYSANSKEEKQQENAKIVLNGKGEKHIKLGRIYSPQ